MAHKAASLGFRSATLAQKELTTKFKVGDRVVLSGWVSFMRKQKGISFMGLRDAFGSIQVVLANQGDFTARLEDVVTVTGTLVKRQGSKAEEFEINAEAVKLENSTRHPLPLGVDNKDLSQIQTPQQRDASLRHRYLDIRLRPYLQNNIRLRGVTALAMRNYLSNEVGFLEVETPTLFKSTPEGAREFLVPVAKTEKDTQAKFYALVQSPQQYKQMLMVAGIDRYFQFARCYRDEGGRADRQPEFTQLDLEMSFLRESKDIERIIEGVVVAGWSAAHSAQPTIVPRSPAVNVSFPRMKLDDAMRDYGSDKPDLRFGMRINNEDRSITAPLLWGALSNKEKNELKRQLVQERVVDELRNVGDDVIVRVKELDVKRLGRARLIIAQWMRQKSVPLPEGMMQPNSPLWITDFGLFESAEEDGRDVLSVHHPFTAPHPDDLPKLDKLLRDVRDATSETQKRALRQHLFSGLRGLHYDLVCDGVELGGGSVRIHSADLQMRVFRDALGMDETECQVKFGHLLEALNLGAPPHGGFALGFDRFIAMLCNAPSISDTLAFPKASTGTDPLSGGPCALNSKEEKSILARFGLTTV